MSVITLKSVRVLERASQGTTCYEALVYVDNRKAGVVSNSGRGGCSSVTFFDKSTHGHLLTQKFEIGCFCGGLDPSCSICKGTGRYMAPIDELLDHLMERAQLDKEVAKLKRKGCTVALITDSKVYGLTTSMSSEEAVRAAATGLIKEIIKEVRFI